MRTSSPHPITVRPVRESDWDNWLPLWDGYNAFYGNQGETALDPVITQTTWQRFFDPAEPVFAFVAESEGHLLGLTHFIYHRGTSHIKPLCYLEDLFTAPEARGQGVARALIEAVYAEAQRQGIPKVYWQTHETNATGRLLYDRIAKNHGFIVYSHNV